MLDLPTVLVLLVAHHAEACTAGAIRGVCKVFRDHLADSRAALKDRPELTSITPGSGGMDLAIAHTVSNLLVHGAATATDWAHVPCSNADPN